MSARSVHLESIELIAARGIRHGEGFSLGELSPGINLVWGPNGSGKSTTALAIEALLWPGAMRLARPTLRGVVRDDEDRWVIEIDAGLATAQCNGERRDPPALAPAESRHRHHLALHELIVAEDAEFAKRIADAGRGGFDLDAAVERLGFAARPSVPHGLVRSAGQASHALLEAQRTQEQLVAAERRLDSSRQKLAQAQRASSRLSTLETARRWRSAADEFDRAERALAALPEGLRRLRGDERERLDDLARRRTETATSLHRRRGEADEAERTIRDLGLPERGIDEATVAIWRGRIVALRHAAEAHGQRQRERAAAVAMVAECRRQIGEACTDEMLDRLGPTERRTISAFVHRALRCTAAEAMLAEHARLLEESLPRELPSIDGDAFREAVGALGRWLAAAAPPVPASAAEQSTELRRIGRLAGLTLISMLLLALAIVLLGIFVNWWWLIGVLICVAIAIWLGRVVGETSSSPGTTDASVSPDSSGPGVDERPIHRSAFERTGVGGPSTWERGEVIVRIGELVGAMAQQARVDECRRERAAIDARRSEVARLRAELEAERRELAQRLGVPISLSSADPGRASGAVDSEWLALLVSQLERWQEARSRAAAAQAEAEAGAQVIRDTIAGLRASVEGAIGVAVATLPDDSVEACSAWIESIVAREGRRTLAARERERVGASIAELERTLVELSSARTSIYHQCGLAEDDDATLDAWRERLPEREAVKTTRAAQQAIRDECRHELDGDPEAMELVQLDAAAIEQAIADAQGVAATRDDLQREIVSIEGQIALAKGGTEISARIAERDRALEALSESCDASSAAIIGHRLVEFVRGIEGNRSRPAVFRRAAELLATFTRGGLTLELSERDGASAFLARRGGGAARPVDELSRGERIQLLMAVRLAFIETEERARLPLLIDEALATSDDERTAVIIDTVIEIARSGRQIFCFTAQRDEVAKWRTRLEAASMAHRIIDLAEARGLARAAALPLAAVQPAITDLPAPGDDDRIAYGQRLGVPGIDPRDVAQDGLHVWHLIDDPSLLHQVLARGVTTWGQMRTLLDHDAAAVLDLDASTIGRARAVATAIVTASALWRTGRGTPVDRSVLMDAAGISRTFLDRVVELATACGGDAESLIAQLRSGALDRWRQDNTDVLREWLSDRGHLDEAPRLSPADLRIRLLAASSSAIERGEIDHAVIDRVAAGLP